MPFGPQGTREGGAWRKQLASVSATPARGRNAETTVLPSHEKNVGHACLGRTGRLVKDIGGFFKNSVARFKTVWSFTKRVPSTLSLLVALGNQIVSITTYAGCLSITLAPCRPFSRFDRDQVLKRPDAEEDWRIC